MYIVMSRSAQVSGRAKDYGPYRHLGIVEINDQWAEENPGREPAMISTRAKGVVRVVRDSGGLYAGGTTMRSEYRRIKARYEAEVDRLNLQDVIKKRAIELVSALDAIPLPPRPIKQPVRRIYRMEQQSVRIN